MVKLHAAAWSTQRQQQAPSAQLLLPLPPAAAAARADRGQAGAQLVCRLPIAAYLRVALVCAYSSSESSSSAASTRSITCKGKRRADIRSF